LDLPQKLFSKVIRAVVEFEMIEDGDKILIGVSGGKDSIFLTHALATLRERLKKKFEISALTINPMFNEKFEVDKIREICEELGISHEVEIVDIASVLKSQQNKRQCFTCAYFRRAAFNRHAKEVAYAHHLDDAVETFAMSLFSSGQLTTFKPKTYLDRMKITVIRPLIYLREAEISEYIEGKGINIIKSPCPIDGKTNRQRVKETLTTLESTFPGIFAKMAAAMRKNSIGDLWEGAKSKEEMRKTYYEYVKGRSE